MIRKAVTQTQRKILKNIIYTLSSFIPESKFQAEMLIIKSLGGQNNL